jgi:pimeloyl-ACP methyl ester carboxylesterase
MAEVHGPGVHFSYETAGDGFPLVLTPGPQGIWDLYIPLLGELCRTIAYVGHDLADVPPTEGRHPNTRAAETLGMFLDLLGLERVYVASQADSWSMALHFALHCPGRLEGLVLLGTRDVTTHALGDVMSFGAHLPTIPVPTFVVIEAAASAALPYADLLAERLPRCTRLVVADTTPAASSSSPALRLGHAMMRFLLHCERQRTLVRGASFLL